MAASSFASANVSGLFFVSMDVQDRAGHQLSSISRSTRHARHVVTVENFSSLTQNVRVTVRLPNLKHRLEFVDHAGGTHDNWNGVRMGIASGVTVDLESQVRRTSGTNPSGEPIQCDDVEDSVGTLAWASGSSGVPFSMKIPVT